MPTLNCILLADDEEANLFYNTTIIDRSFSVLIEIVKKYLMSTPVFIMASSSVKPRKKRAMGYNEVSGIYDKPRTIEMITRMSAE